MVEVFFIPAYIILIIFGAFGCLLLTEKFNPAVYMLLIVVLGITVYSNFNISDRSNNFFAYDYGINLFKSMEKDGALLVAGTILRSRQPICP